MSASQTKIVRETNIVGLPDPNRGKVRDIYDLGDSLLIVTTDRISAFDVVLPTGIPDKGKVLNQLSLFWFGLTADIVENHLITADISEMIGRIGRVVGVMNLEQCREMLDGRSMIVNKAEPLAIECVVRGYISGSGWKEYKTQKEANPTAKEINLYGHLLPPDLVESQKLPTAIFTPATKEETGHDENITLRRACEIVGENICFAAEDASLAIFSQAAETALKSGIIIADTKFEFGMRDGKIILIDEAMTPDSSRFWDASTYEPGHGQPSFDKQFVRDYLLTLDWDQTPPGPELPDEIVAKTAEKYREAYRRIVGRDLY